MTQALPSTFTSGITLAKRTRRANLSMGLSASQSIPQDRLAPYDHTGPPVPF